MGTKWNKEEDSEMLEELDQLNRWVLRAEATGRHHLASLMSADMEELEQRYSDFQGC